MCFYASNDVIDTSYPIIGNIRLHVHYHSKVWMHSSFLSDINFLIMKTFCNNIELNTHSNIYLIYLNLGEVSRTTIV